MLADSVLQTLGRSTHVPTIAVAHVFIDNITLLKMGRTSLCVAGKIPLVEKTTSGWTAQEQLVIPR